MSLYEQIYAVVRLIPSGRVTTYGRIAEHVECGARQVGYALHALAENRGEPWHRVVGARWTISLPRGTAEYELQTMLLAAEGVVLEAAGRVPEQCRYELPKSNRPSRVGR